MTTIAGMPPKNLAPPPPAGSKWERIEQAREELGWDGRDISRAISGKKSTIYNTIRSRNWGAHEKTVDRIIARLVEAGYREAWLRMGELPAKGDGSPAPELPSILLKLRQLSRRLVRNEQEILGLWANIERAGPLENLPDEIRRAAFAAAYMYGRSFEDVARAVAIARKTTKLGAGVETWLAEIRVALRSVAHGSGEHPTLSSLPPPKKLGQ